ncbi:hypothetical protein ACFYVL_09110 [Streptomyces sp. NPDC004111]|uniref:hypothetical protein n=1 Tax=Streptomyces sp. NPDC004111 TaxID=3364690 RepID=UPI00367B33A8
MNTCRRFKAVRDEYVREIGYMAAHAARYADKPSGKSSAKQADSAKARMARALTNHVGRCPECG